MCDSNVLDHRTASRTCDTDCQTNGCTTAEASLPIPRLLPIQKKKLVLHFDLNNTILVSDAVTKQGTIASLEYFLSTVTWGRMTKGKNKKNNIIYHFSF